MYHTIMQKEYPLQSYWPKIISMKWPFYADDFNANATPLTFTNSVTSRPCSILLMDDLIIENPETFLLSLSLVNPADSALSASAAQPSVATVTITDDGKCKSSCNNIACTSSSCKPV